MSLDLETRALPLAGLRVEFRDDELKPRIVGMAAVFDSLSEDLGGFRERIKPGAFGRSLKEGADVRALIDHDPSLILGRTKAGTLELRETKKGLLAAIDPPNTSRARDLLESLKRGDVDAMSFGFRTVADDWHMEDGKPVRELLDVDLFDVSVVTFPAYPATEVGTRSLALWRQRAWRPSLGHLRRRLKLMGG